MVFQIICLMQTISSIPLTTVGHNTFWGIKLRGCSPIGSPSTQGLTFGSNWHGGVLICFLLRWFLGAQRGVTPYHFLFPLWALAARLRGVSNQALCSRARTTLSLFLVLVAPVRGWTSRPVARPQVNFFFCFFLPEQLTTAVNIPENFRGVFWHRRICRGLLI